MARLFLSKSIGQGFCIGASVAFNPKLDQLSPWSFCRTRSTPTRRPGRSRLTLIR
jgi:hypothetical protein